VKNHLGTRDYHFVAFPLHLLDQDRDLHFAARIDLRGANRGDAEQNGKGKGGNQVLRKDDIASLKNWAG
jgi:hypothetical protein